MYHPGKVIEVFSNKDKNIDSNDDSTQAMLEMWDDNLITVLVDIKLNSKVKKDDIVLVDYRPMQTQPVPRLTIVKVLKGATAKRTWSIYRDHQNKKRVAMPTAEKIRPPGQSYVG